MLLCVQVYCYNQVEIKSPLAENFEADTILNDDNNNNDECTKPCTLQALYLSVQHQVWHLAFYLF